jgi:hypothetical protein
MWINVWWLLFHQYTAFNLMGQRNTPYIMIFFSKNYMAYIKERREYVPIKLEGNAADIFVGEGIRLVWVTFLVANFLYFFNAPCRFLVPAKTRLEFGKIRYLFPYFFRSTLFPFAMALGGRCH